MRIAHVTFSFWPIRGGADAYLAELAKVFVAAGHEQTVFQAALPSPPASLPSLGERAVNLIQWPVPPHLSPGRRFWLLTAQVARHREELRSYDRIIAHYPNYALPLSGHPGLIGLSHGVTWDCGSPFALSNRVKKGVAEAAFRRARRYVANDTFFLREMGLPIAPQTEAWSEAAPGKWVFPNAVDTRHFSPDPALPVEPILLLPRNLYRNRGIHLAIEAFAALAEVWPALRLRIAGDRGDAGYREECETLAANLSVSHRVEFAGSVAWREMPNEYRRALVTLIPSLCGEGTSLSALESMACGTPVVATTAGGLPDLPCLHAKADADAFAAAIHDALQYRESLSSSQRDAVLSNFTLERWAETWLRVVD